MNNNLLKKFLSYSYGGFLGAIIGFITTMITTRILSPEEFGKASMFTLVSSICMITIIFGTDQAFVRFFYEENEKKRGALLFNCLKIAAVISVPFFIIFILYREPVSILLFGEYSFVVIVLLLVGVLLQVLNRFALLVVRMQQKGKLYSTFEVLNRIFILVGVISFYALYGSSYTVLVFATVISYGILIIFQFIGQKNFWSLKNLKIEGTKHSKKEIIKYSYPLLMTMLLTWLFEGMDKIALRQWSDFQEIGLYSAAFKIIALLTILKGVFSTFWVPVAYETYEKNPQNKSFFSRVSIIVSFLMLALAILVIMSKDLIILLLGNEYVEAGLMLSFLVFIPVMYTISETTVLGINFSKKVKWHVGIALVVCLCNIAGNYLLVPEYGGVGASISTGISYILFFTLRTFISLKYFKVNYELKKIYSSVLIVALYAGYVLFELRLLNQIIAGMISLFIITLIYRNFLIGEYKAYKRKKI
ncbi:polysaccharide biosynthesis protein [Paenibacillus sp. 1011MAR3C5]|uniref:lipopolysaccharide biosynthesis protein n=1 Tax=Paenibacillus sp. 1011MAR3C5 TaxID=1675787 RepID=UPI000E6C666C|nr:oligosaccharide flippase family protein [Paenibacillus sp. 1011MAR3C5]RJE83624.1 polysaccharide biosynthesis protein [Paenibacillus sp. 1011MAR3C5]